MKCVPSLQEKDADLQDRFVHTQLSPKEDWKDTSSWFIHWVPLTWRENFVLYQDSSLGTSLFINGGRYKFKEVPCGLYWNMRIWYSFIHLTKWRERRVTYKQPIGYINQCSLYDKCYFYHLSIKKRVAIFFSPAILRLKCLQSKMKKSPVKYDDAIAFIPIRLFLVQ